MDLLLDTNALIFISENSSRLTEKTLQTLEDTRNQKFISLASLWEISLKVAKGRLIFDLAKEPNLPEILENNAISTLPLSWKTIQTATNLPFHHRDPFDRMIVAEAKKRQLVVVSTDHQLDAYEIQRIC